MPKAFVIGGSGQIGFAVGILLASEGWSVEISSRQPPRFDGPCRYVELDVGKSADFATTLKDDYDLLISCVAFDDDDAKRILDVQSRLKRIVVISSASVYRDSAGRTLDEASECGFPVFNGPITEATETVPPGRETYSTRKVAMENELLENAEIPVTILRPCAIHGPYSKHCREWWFVKRILDGRQHIPLAYKGRSRFQTTSTSSIAEIILRSTRETLPTIINVADSDSPSVKQIGQAILNIMSSNAELVELEDESYPTIVGATPWSVPLQFICGSVARSNKTYEETVPATVSWLMDAVQGRQWQNLLPQLASYPRNLFDYDSEDEIFANYRHE